MIRVLAIGHVCYDIILSLEEYPQENTKYVLPRSLESSGGPACNAASLLGLWGIPTAFAGLAGQDMYGTAARGELSAAGVDTRLLELRPGHATPLSIVLVNRRTASRTILNRKPPEGRLELAESMLREAYSGAAPSLLHLDGHETEASLAAMKAFPKAITVLDAGSRRPGTEILSPLVDYCVASERFAAEMTGVDLSREFTDAASEGREAKKALEGLLALGTRRAAITLGERGCCYVSAPESPARIAGREPSAEAFRLPALPVSASDTTAAGDIFHGAFAAGLLEGRDFAGALRLAAAAAGLSVQRQGGRTSIPSREEALRAEKSGRLPAAEGIGPLRTIGAAPR